MTCSPCRIDVRELGRAWPAAPQRSAWSRRGWAAAAASLIFGVGLGVWVTERSSRGPMATTGDLRKYALSRSDQPQFLEQPLPLPRQRLRLTLLLPNGSESGRYELQLLDGDRRTHATAEGKAILRDFVTSLSAELDLSSVASGAYQLAVRRTGEDWQLFPARVE